MNKTPKRKIQSKAATSDIILIQSMWKRHLAVKERKRLKKMYTERSNIAKELLDTEKKYFNSLNDLHSVFLLPLQNSPKRVLGRELHTSLNLLTSIVKVIISYHEIILSSLTSRVCESWGPNTKLGDIFSEMSSYLKAYTQYVTHYQPVLRQLKNRHNDSSLSELLDRLVIEQCRGKRLQDYLIMPIQRIPRYSLMLSDLVKKTDNKHCDYLNLQGALLKIVTVCEYVEQMSDHAIKLEKKMELATKILFPKDASVVLALPHRKYLWEDCVTLSADLSLSGTRSIHHQETMIFAFSDLLVFCKELSKGDSFKSVLTVPTESIRLYDQQTGEGGNGLIILKTYTGEVLVERSSSSSESFSTRLLDYLKQLGPSPNFLPTLESIEKDNRRKTIHVQRQNSVMGLPSFADNAPSSPSAYVNTGSKIRHLSLKKKEKSKDRERAKTLKLSRSFSVTKFARDRSTTTTGRSKVESVSAPSHENLRKSSQTIKVPF